MQHWDTTLREGIQSKNKHRKSKRLATSSTTKARDETSAKKPQKTNKQSNKQTTTQKQHKNKNKTTKSKKQYKEKKYAQ